MWFFVGRDWVENDGGSTQCGSYLQKVFWGKKKGGGLLERKSSRDIHVTVQLPLSDLSHLEILKLKPQGMIKDGTGDIVELFVIGQRGSLFCHATALCKKELPTRRSSPDQAIP
jgi:hypothetical protein